MIKKFSKTESITINNLATECLVLLQGLSEAENDRFINIDKELLMRLTTGYLLMYETVIEHSIVPTPPKYLGVDYLH
jgi:hypothetical protein